MLLHPKSPFNYLLIVYSQLLMYKLQMDIKNKIGLRIRDARAMLARRLGRKVTQKELGGMCGWLDGQGRISHYENGKREPSFFDLQVIAEKTGVTVQFLMGVGESEEPIKAKDIDHEKLERSIAAIESYIQKNNLAVPPGKKSKLIAAIYRLSHHENKIRDDNLLNALLEIL